MAGAFGFEAGDHYDVSMKCGEEVLLPAVRKAEKDTLIIANGFSCREQIKQGTDREALHLAQVMQMALREGENGAAGDYPEKEYVTQPPARASQLRTAALIGGGVLLLMALLKWLLGLRAGDRSTLAGG
jgi:hypothetical protein